MPKKALSPSQETIGALTDIRPAPEQGFSDTEKVVVPIRADLQQIILNQLKEDLKWQKAITESPNANDSPSWSKRVKMALRNIPLLEARIAAIEAGLEQK